MNGSPSWTRIELCASCLLRKSGPYSRLSGSLIQPPRPARGMTAVEGRNGNQPDACDEIQEKGLGIHKLTATPETGLRDLHRDQPGLRRDRAVAALPGAAPGSAVRLSPITHRYPQGCDPSGAATVTAGLVAGATRKRVSAEPWLGGFRPLNAVPGQTGPLLRADRRTTGGADGGEEGMTPDDEAGYSTYATAPTQQRMAW